MRSIPPLQSERSQDRSPERHESPAMHRPARPAPGSASPRPNSRRPIFDPPATGQAAPAETRRRGVPSPLRTGGKGAAPRPAPGAGPASSPGPTLPSEPPAAGRHRWCEPAGRPLLRVRVGEHTGSHGPGRDQRSIPSEPSTRRLPPSFARFPACQCRPVANCQSRASRPSPTIG